VTRARWLWLVRVFIAFPFTARADGIDLPILITYGVGNISSAATFQRHGRGTNNGRFLAIKFSELGRHVQSQRLVVVGRKFRHRYGTSADGWFRQRNWQTGSRLPAFSSSCHLRLFAGTCLGGISLRSKGRSKGGSAGQPVRDGTGRSLANLASYAILGPVYFFIEYPRTEIHEFMADARWAKEPKLTVVAIGQADDWRRRAQTAKTPGVVPPRYGTMSFPPTWRRSLRGAGDRLTFSWAETNLPLPELGLWCRAPEMDFSPTGKYAAFF